MIDLKEYILLPKTERQLHIDLESPCLERGGNSTNHKGVLAQYLNTNIPTGRILLCHACGNGACSEPTHLYWGTDRENIVEDGKKFGTWKSPWERLIEKHSYEEACQNNSRRMKGNKYGAGNKGNPKSEEHKRKIAEKRQAQTNNAGGRKPAMPYDELISLVKDMGISNAAKHIGISVAALRSRHYNALNATKSGLGEIGETQGA